MLTAAAGLALMSPPDRPVPEMEVIVLSPEADGADPQGHDYRVRRTSALLATMHDQGVATIRTSDIDSKTFAACLGKFTRDHEANEAQQDNCVRGAMPHRQGKTTIAVVVRQMRWRSAAQQLTCIAGGEPNIGRSSVHLRDIFHRYDFVRAAARNRARECLATALGHGAAARN